MTTQRLKFFYDGACPLCRREIALYRALDKQGRHVDWQDVSGGDQSVEVCPGLTKRGALRAMHAELPSGELVRGAAALVELWRALPGFRWIAPLASWRPVLWCLERAYRGFLRIRPALTGRRPLES